MTAYQHKDHAGNHGDVLKHVVLQCVLAELLREAGPLCVFDAHAGAGLYDLGNRLTSRRDGSLQDLRQVLEAADPPPALLPYLHAVAACNSGGPLRRYPGSPWLACFLLRPADRLHLMEKQPRLVMALQAASRHDSRVHVEQADCFERLPLLLPPAEGRGLVLIDPPYEQTDEYEKAARLLTSCLHRWPEGVYLLWYPLLAERRHEQLLARVAGSGPWRLYRLEMEIRRGDAPGMRGSGVLVANLPRRLEGELGALLSWLRRRLAADGQGGVETGRL